MKEKDKNKENIKKSKSYLSKLAIVLSIVVAVITIWLVISWVEGARHFYRHRKEDNFIYNYVDENGRIVTTLEKRNGRGIIRKSSGK